MGANTSALLPEEIEEIETEYNLSQAEIKRLYKRFQKLDRNHSGTLEPDELLMIPELAMNPLVPRIVSVFDSVNFRQFVKELSVFGPNSSTQAKVDFAFRIYDCDADGYVSREDLEKILRMMVGDNIDDDSLARVVQKVIEDADTDGDGKIAPSEFSSAVDVADITNRLTLVL